MVGANLSVDAVYSLLPSLLKKKEMTGVCSEQSWMQMDFAIADFPFPGDPFSHTRRDPLSLRLDTSF